MSTIDIDARLKEKKLTQESIELFIKDYLGYDTKVIETFGNTVKSEICDNSELKTEMYLVDCDYDKGKCWESSIIGDDFYFKQLLSIGLEKEEADMDRIYSVICFFRHVAKETNAEILVTSAIHNDICLLRGDIVFWDEHFHQIYKSQIDNLREETTYE